MLSFQYFNLLTTNQPKLLKNNNKYIKEALIIYVLSGKLLKSKLIASHIPHFSIVTPTQHGKAR